MASNSGLVTSEIQGATVVNFRNQSILDGTVIHRIATELYALVEEQAHRKIILDFTDVRFLSSQMLGTLIALQKKSVLIQGKIVICGLRPDLAKVFKIMKLEKLFAFAADEHEALTKLGIFAQT
jgi:anti-sigma B factor antagonist